MILKVEVWSGLNRPATALIQNQHLNKLNRIKKISLEAFFYLLEIEKIAE